MSDGYGETRTESSDCGGSFLRGFCAGDQGTEKKINLLLAPPESFSQQGDELIPAGLFCVGLCRTFVLLNLSKSVRIAFMVFFCDSLELPYGCSCLILNISQIFSSSYWVIVI